VITFLTAVALAIAVEGLIYFAFPEQMKRILAAVQELPPATIRVAGFTCAAGGLILLWLLRGF